MDLVCWCLWRLGCLWQPSKKVLWLLIGHDIMFFWFIFKISTFSPRLFLIFSDNLEELLCSLFMIMVVCINTLAFACNFHNAFLVFVFVFVFDKNYSRTLQIEDDQGTLPRLARRETYSGKLQSNLSDSSFQKMMPRNKLLSAIDLVNEVSGFGSVAGVVNPGQPSRGNADIETHTLNKMIMMVMVNI